MIRSFMIAAQEQPAGSPCAAKKGGKCLRPTCCHHFLLTRRCLCACVAGLGNLSKLSDDLLLNILHLLPAEALGALALCSKALYCFCSHEDLWKALVLESLTAAEDVVVPESARSPCNGTQQCGSESTTECPASPTQPQIVAGQQTQTARKKRRLIAASSETGRCTGNGDCATDGTSSSGQQCTQTSFSWNGSWRETYLASHLGSPPKARAGRLKVGDFYSDMLYQPWFCATLELFPEWLEVDNVDRCVSSGC